MIKSITSGTLSWLLYFWLQCQRQITLIFLSMHLDVSDVPSKTKSCPFCLETRVSGRCFGLCLSGECVRMRCFINLKPQLTTRIKHTPGKEMYAKSSPHAKGTLSKTNGPSCAQARDVTWHVWAGEEQCRCLDRAKFQFLLSEPKQNPSGVFEICRRAFDVNWCKCQWLLN